MKDLVSVVVNDKEQDAIIDSYMKCTKDENGKVIYSNPEEGIGPCKGTVFEIIIYVKDRDDCNKVEVIKIHPYSIKKLYAIITEIEQKVSEELIED